MKRNYDDPTYKTWRLKVYSRDRFKCQMPGCKYGGKKIHAHHIKKWSTHAGLRYDVDNGITLCDKCHQEVNRNEIHYETLFMSIIRNKHG